MAQKKYLLDVCIIRFALIFILVAYHAFCPYSGIWDSPDGFQTNKIYYCLGLFFISFMLESFVFISGLVFGYQIRNRGKENVCNRHLITNKLKRLILPSIFFSAIYFVLFIDTTNTPFDITSLIWDGFGHMWFLPMLFKCFLIMGLLEYFNCNKTIVSILALLSSIICTIYPTPYIDSTPNYFFFFLAGTYIGESNFKIAKYSTFKNIIFSGIIFLILFIAHIKTYNKFFSFPMSLSGVLFVYLLANRIILMPKVHISEKVVNFSNYCFGVYIYQEFILKLLYYNLNLLEICPSLLTPWIGIIITLPLSIILTHLTRQTKFGRYLIG